MPCAGSTSESMLHYCFAHCAYHLSRLLPKTQRLKFQIPVLVFVTVLVGPQFFVLTRSTSSRYCAQPLLSNLTCCILLSFTAAGFAVLLTLTDPVPQRLKAAFHVFGAVSFGEGLCTIALTSTAAQCAKTTPELFYLSYLLAWGFVLTTVFFVVMGGFWIVNALYPGKILDHTSKRVPVRPIAASDGDMDAYMDTRVAVSEIKECHQAPAKRPPS